MAVPAPASQSLGLPLGTCRTITNQVNCASTASPLAFESAAPHFLVSTPFAWLHLLMVTGTFVLRSVYLTVTL